VIFDSSGFKSSNVFFDALQALLKLSYIDDASIIGDQACQRRSFTRRNLPGTYGINYRSQRIDGIGGTIHYW
jgi:hypothetical protein